MIVRKLFGENPIETVVNDETVKFDAEGNAEVSEAVAETLRTIPGYEVAEEQEKGNDEGEDEGEEDEAPEKDEQEAPSKDETPAEEPAPAAPKKAAPRRPAPKKA